ncbi:hypothetical protein PC110_g22427 [Phytophthora cactorum]|uniref:Uncharacterized protein n=1 Tax=Phytophthora cactorum TaxID=29920 RepID=A0A329R9N7_9STRA|nr:hypothetical protein PC110_g22427 [Phytophthora cactorum]
MYQDASWASDATKGVSLTSKSQSDASTQSDDDSKKGLSTENSPKKKPELSTVNVGTQAEGETVNVGTQAEGETVDVGVNTRPERTDRNIQASPNTSDKSNQASPNTSDIGTETENPKMVDAEVDARSKFVDDEEQVESRKWGKELICRESKLGGTTYPSYTTERWKG